MFFYLAVGLLYPLTFNAPLHCIKKLFKNSLLGLGCYFECILVANLCSRSESTFKWDGQWSGSINIQEVIFSSNPMRIWKINFYKSIPLLLWDVYWCIPLLDPQRHNYCLHRKYQIIHQIQVAYHNHMLHSINIYWIIMVHYTCCFKC